MAEKSKFLEVCDITCDADGSVPTRQFASIEQPFHILNVTWRFFKRIRGGGVCTAFEKRFWKWWEGILTKKVSCIWLWLW